MSPNYFRFVRVNEQAASSFTETFTPILQTFTFSFESTGGWFGTISDAPLDLFSANWSDESLSETYENNQNYGDTISDGNLSSFSNSWTDATFSAGIESW